MAVSTAKSSEAGSEGKQAAAAADNPTARRIVRGLCAAGPGWNQANQTASLRKELRKHSHVRMDRRN